MSYKSIGITGSKGVLGSYIKKNLKNVKFDCFNGDITNKRDIQKWLKGKNFEDYIKTKNNDEYIEKFRNYYFIEE